TVEEKKLFRLIRRKNQHVLVKRAMVPRTEGCFVWVGTQFPMLSFWALANPGHLYSKLGRPGQFVIGRKGDQPSRASRSVAQSERHQFRHKLLFLASRRKGLADKDFSSAREFLGFPP